MSIALVDDQTVVWSQGFGYADQARQVKAAPETLYRAGSISKLFTATAAMKLVEQGRFDLDRPVQSYVPKCSIRTRFPDTGPITPRLLMTHHSGLPGEYLKGAQSDDSFSDTVENFHDEYVAYPPNLLLTYSNLGVTLLGHAIENACGKPFRDCLESELLQPLDMRQSAFSSSVSFSPLMSKGYEKGQEFAQPLHRDIPAGGLNSTVLDLSHFIQMVFASGQAGNRAIVSAAHLSQMLRPQNTNVPLDFDTRIGPGLVSQSDTVGAAHRGTQRQYRVVQQHVDDSA